MGIRTHSRSSPSHQMLQAVWNISGVLRHRKETPSLNLGCRGCVCSSPELPPILPLPQPQGRPREMSLQGGKVAGPWVWVGSESRCPESSRSQPAFPRKPLLPGAGGTLCGG